ncbi:hypothetical protein LZ190_21035, partial [Rhodovulum sulfidophilum]|nr:hypothetical protein [Rhodovulum sulfidophilum]
FGSQVNLQSLFNFPGVLFTSFVNNYEQINCSSISRKRPGQARATRRPTVRKSVRKAVLRDRRGA